VSETIENTRHLPPQQQSSVPEAETFSSEVKQLLGMLGIGDASSRRDGTTRSHGAASSSPEGDLPQIEGCEVVGEIARGGMGRVLAARDTRLGRDVAIKMLLHPRADAAVRFVRESILTARLPHPGVPPVHALGSLADGSPFLAMKLIRGQTLAALLAERPSPAHELPHFIQVFEQVCQAVGFAHSQGIIHRDLKPLNIMVGAFGEVQVMDWGLAKELAGRRQGEGQGASLELPPGGAGDTVDSTRVGQASETPDNHAETRAGSVMGTHAYMPPEQALGELERMGPWSDVFSLGGNLCQILTGQPPYVGTDLHSLWEQASKADLREAHRFLDCCSADDELIRLCKWCLAPETENRPPNGKAVAEGVAAFRRGLEERTRKAESERAAASARAEEAAHRAEAEERARQAADARAAEQRKRRRVQLALGGVLLAASAAFVWWDDRQHQLQQQRQIRNHDAAATLLAEVESALRAGDAHAAASALEQVEKRVAEGGADELRPHLQQCRTDLKLLQELDSIDADRWTVTDGKMPSWDSIASRFSAAFAGHGIVPGSLSPEEASRRINDSLIRERLLISLEVWFVESGRTASLREILERADPDEFRNEARRSSYPRAVLASAFHDKPVPAEQPPWFAIAHGDDRKADQGPREHLLLSAHRARPNNFSLLMTLGVGRTDAEGVAALRRASWNLAAIAVKPNSAAAWHNLGVALGQAGDTTGAINAYREAIRIDPRHAAAHHNLGMDLYATGNLPQAIAESREAIRLDPTIVSAHNNLGHALRASGNLPLAIAAYEDAIKADPRRALSYFNLGLALADSGDSKRAIVAYQEAIRLDGRDVLAHVNLGRVLAKTGELAKAIAACREAIEIDDKRPEAYFELGAALHEARDWPGAIAAFEKVIKLQPDYPSAHTRLGIALLAANEGEKAIAAFREAVRLDPRDDIAYNRLGMALADADDLPGAIDAFREAIRIDPDFSKARLNLGIALQESGDFKGSIPVLQEVIRREPRNEVAYNRLGLAARETGDLAAARPAFEAAVRIDPEFAKAHANLARVLLEQKRYRESIAAAREAIRHDVQYAEGHGVLGLALLETGDVVGARAALSAAVDLDSDTWEPCLLKLPPLAIAPPPRQRRP
jgi:tetratricopeptide (TPR) repeat protein